MSGTNSEINLDRLCARAGHDLACAATGAFEEAKRAEALLTKSLGVVQEQGLYAFFLFLASRSDREKQAADTIRDGSARLLKETSLLDGGVRPTEILESLRRDDGLLTRLDDLLLGVELISRALTYARFHAKALKVEGVPSASQARGTP